MFPSGSTVGTCAAERVGWVSSALEGWLAWTPSLERQKPAIPGAALLMFRSSNSSFWHLLTTHIDQLTISPASFDWRLQRLGPPNSADQQNPGDRRQAHSDDLNLVPHDVVTSPQLSWLLEPHLRVSSLTRWPPAMLDLFPTFS
jgi:hypothetical protein